MIEHPGTLAGWLTVVGVLVVAWHVRRGFGGSALEILERANKVLTTRLAALELELKDAKSKIAELERTRSLAPIVESLTHVLERANDGLERRAQERHLAELGVLELIASRLGPEE